MGRAARSACPAWHMPGTCPARPESPVLAMPKLGMSGPSARRGPGGLSRAWHVPGMARPAYILFF